MMIAPISVMPMSTSALTCFIRGLRRSHRSAQYGGDEHARYEGSNYQQPWPPRLAVPLQLRISPVVSEAHQPRAANPRIAPTTILSNWGIGSSDTASAAPRLQRCTRPPIRQGSRGQMIAHV